MLVVVVVVVVVELVVVVVVVVVEVVVVAVAVVIVIVVVVGIEFCMPFILFFSFEYRVCDVSNLTIYLMIKYTLFFIQTVNH